MPRARIFATVDSELARQINTLHKVRCEAAEKNGSIKPGFSHIVEELLRKGVRNTPLLGINGEDYVP